MIEWRNPWWFLLALQPLLVMLALHWPRADGMRYADLHLHPWVVLGRPGAAYRDWRTLANAVGWILLACAAAGPRMPLDPVAARGAETPYRQYHKMDLMVVLDVSPSMSATDVSPQRLERAKLELQDLLRRLRGERVGLVAYSGTAGLLAPLTDDYQAFRYFLGFAEPSLFDTAGSNLGAALELAAQTLGDDKAAARAILLLTDGDAAELSGATGALAAKAAAHLRRTGIPLYILAVAGATQAAAPGGGKYDERNDGSALPSSDLHALRTLASIAQGKFEMASDGDGDWRSLYDAGIRSLPGEKQLPSLERRWRELYPWCLLPAIVLLALAQVPLPRPSRLSGIGLLAAFLLAAGSVPRPVQAAQDAGQTASRKAYAAYLSGQFEAAQSRYGALQGYAARMGEGAAAYRLNRYGEAGKQFTAALLEAATPRQRADALFNLGNSLYLEKDFRAAADAYRGALVLQPGDGKAQANLALAARQLAAQSGLDRYSQGILARRARRDGHGMREGGTQRPVGEPDEQSGLVSGGGDAVAAGARTGADSGAAPDANRSGYRPEDAARLYRAAAKKLELLNDRAVSLEREMVKRDTPRGTPVPEGMHPW